MLENEQNKPRKNAEGRVKDKLKKDKLKKRQTKKNKEFLKSSTNTSSLVA